MQIWFCLNYTGKYYSVQEKFTVFTLITFPKDEENVKHLFTFAKSNICHHVSGQNVE